MMTDNTAPGLTGEQQALYNSLHSLAQSYGVSLAAQLMVEAQGGDTALMQEVNSKHLDTMKNQVQLIYTMAPVDKAPKRKRKRKNGTA